MTLLLYLCIHYLNLISESFETGLGHSLQLLYSIFYVVFILSPILDVPNFDEIT